MIESQDKQNFDSTCTIFNLHSGVTTLHWCYNIAFVLLEKCTQFFSLIYNFFMYITRKKIMMGSFDLIRFVTSYVLLRRNLVLSACDIILA